MYDILCVKGERQRNIMLQLYHRIFIAYLLLSTLGFHVKVSRAFLIKSMIHVSVRILSKFCMLSLFCNRYSLFQNFVVSLSVPAEGETEIGLL